MHKGSFHLRRTSYKMSDFSTLREYYKCRQCFMDNFGFISPVDFTALALFINGNGEMSV